MNLRDTIVALSTPLARSGLGIVRLSGDQSRAVVEQILRIRSPLEARRATVAELLAEDGAPVDRVVVTWFAAPHSYTSEDVVEISCHGSPVVLRHCVERAVMSGARLAEPGEFTLRAYLRGRIDLPQAEAIHDLIESTTLYQAQVAARQMEGSVSARIRPTKEKLVELISLLEAGIDFAEDDVSVASSDEILVRLRPIRDALVAMAGSFEQGRLVFGGATLAIAGRPNVGKSSLFNRLLEQERAIVTAVPGTTRDTVSEAVALHGIPLSLVDTAGIRESADLVEQLGIERSFQAIADADATLLVLDGSTALMDEDRKLMEKLHDRKPVLVANKSDLSCVLAPELGALEVSATTGAGIDQLREALLERIAPFGLAAPEDGAITNIRQVALLRESAEALAHAESAVSFSLPHEMLLLDLYAALRPLDAVTGATTADDILNRIFATFCIGK